MGAIKNAFKSIAKGIEKAVQGVGQIAKGLVTLDLKGAAAGLKKLGEAGGDIARGAINLTPAALAANTLLDGALDKVLKKVQSVAQKVVDTAVDSVEGGLSNIKNGAIGLAKGIAKGNLSQALNGIKDLALGAMETASNFGPGGIAKNVARLAVDSTIDLATQEVTKAASKVLDPNGTSLLGGLAVDTIGAATSGGLSSSRAGRFADGESFRKGANDLPDTRSTGLRQNGDDLSGMSPTGFRQGARDAAETAARDAVDTVVQSTIDKLMLSLQQTLDPNNDSNAVGTGTNLLGGALQDAASTAVQTRGRRGTDGSRHAQGPDEVPPQTRREAVKESVQNSVHNAVDMAIQAAVQAALYTLLPKLGLDQNSALAALGQGVLEDTLSNVSSPRNATGLKSGSRQVASDLKQGLQNSIQEKLLGVADQAIQGIVDQVMAKGLQGLQPTGGASSPSAGGVGSQLGSDLRSGIQDRIQSVVKDVISGVMQSVIDTANQGVAAGLSLGKGLPQLPQLPQLPASATETRVSIDMHMHIRA
ncbi:hypothetical protein AVHY2522_22570 [Acidovorax sp. SUPP2522]|uniref:hypothetical protein n=1 Tax=unclassified Acidovorax TaxID=2684926 RepID=UPI00234B32FF|nr:MULTISPECIES: hypothetical protein [unclassified Acidovorax]WCM97293.1 hypothetical protein M5C96_23365 [Acidovorax sp. GBBC 1281]GKT19473.1 hypothetical protein AVHY2522_22570 [Acidovorax sp. SUPP2522]